MKMIKQITDIPNPLNLIVDIKMIQVQMKNLGYYSGPISGKNTEKGYYKAIVAAHKALGIPVDDSGKKIRMEPRGPFLTALWATATGDYANLKPILAADHVMSCPDEMWALDIPDVADMPLPTAVAEVLTERLTRISDKQALPLRLKSEDINVSEDGKLQIKLTVPGNGWLSSTGGFYKALPMGVTSIISIYMRKAGYTVTAGEEDGSVMVHGDLSVQDGEIWNAYTCVGGSGCTVIDNKTFNEAIPQDIKAFESTIIKEMWGTDMTLPKLEQLENYHVYANTSVVTSGKNKSDVDAEYRKSPAPTLFSKRNKPVENGDVTWDVAALTRGPILESIFLPGGKVTHKVDAKTGAIANMTTRIHTLHPGYVIRYTHAIKAQETIVVLSTTIGRGVGTEGGANSYFGAQLFHDLDKKIGEKFK